MAAHAKPIRSSFSTAHGGCAVPAKKATNTNETASPVDLVHLSRQSLGDRSLEREILNLFKSQSALYLDRLSNAKTSDERKLAAHTILGSARGIGAWRVAKEAEAVQADTAHLQDLASLRHCVEEANAYITEILE
jgi:HPt (histidine-containing phosphotransfer) domain-containing protein